MDSMIGLGAMQGPESTLSEAVSAAAGAPACDVLTNLIAFTALRTALMDDEARPACFALSTLNLKSDLKEPSRLALTLEASDAVLLRAQCEDDMLENTGPSAPSSSPSSSTSVS